MDMFRDVAELQDKKVACAEQKKIYLQTHPIP